MKKYLFFLVSLFPAIPLLAQVPNCAIIGIDHFGGNGSDQIYYPGTVNWPDGSFSFTVSTGSTSGNVLTSCIHPNDNRGGVFKTYDANYNVLQGQYCAPKGVDFRGPTFYVYPQNNGDTIIVGRVDPVYRDIGIERRNSSGTVIWTKRYGGSGDEGLVTVREAADGGFYILTGTNSSDGDVGIHYGNDFTGDAWVLRLDNNGDKIWATHFGGSSYEIMSDMIVNEDGSSIYFGLTSSFDYDCTGFKGGSDLYLMKLDSMGNKVWHKCMGGTGNDGSGSQLGVWAKTDHRGGFYVLNATNSQDGDVQQSMPNEMDFWLLHLDSAANIIWENTYGGPNNQYPTAFCQATDGTLWLGGTLLGATVAGGLIDVIYGKEDSWVVHVDSLGQFINQRVMGTERSENLFVLHPLPDGSVLAAGYYSNYGGPAGHSSPGFPQTTEGEEDAFIAHLGPQTVGIKDNFNTFYSWKIFPNPATNNISIQVKGTNNSNYKLNVINNDGKEIFSTFFIESITLKTETWLSGVYILTLTDTQGRKDSKKITIQH